MTFSSVTTQAFMVLRFLLVLAMSICSFSCSENTSKDSYIQAERATNDGDIAKAISLYKSAIEADNSFIEAYQKLGTIYYLQNSYEEAITLLNSLLIISPTNFDAHFILGNIHSKSGKYTKALYHYEQALITNPNDAKLYQNMASAYVNVDNTQLALNYYNKALSIDSKDQEIHYDLANTLARKGNYSEALQHYQSAVQLRPDYAEAWLFMGVTFINQVIMQMQSVCLTWQLVLILL